MLHLQQFCMIKCSSHIVLNTVIFLISAVRLNRVRGGRNKFGALYKQDRAMKRQVNQQRLNMMAALDEVGIT